MEEQQVSTVPGEGRHCADCGADLAGLSAASPCPWCHAYGHRPSPAVEPAPPVEQPAPPADNGRSGVRYRKGGLRWPDHWRLVVHLLGRLQSTGEIGAAEVGPLDVAGWATAFFAECDQLPDWLQGDVRNLPGLDPKKTAKRIARHAERDAVLQQCQQLAAAHRRHKKKGPRSGVPRLVVHAIDGGWQAAVEAGGSGETQHVPVDVAELAGRCVASWRRFFAAHGIDEPGATATSVRP